MTSMASMNISALIEIPRNRYPRNKRYTTPMSPVGKREIPGMLMVLE